MHIRYRPFDLNHHRDFPAILEQILNPLVPAKLDRNFDVNIKETENGYQLEAYLPGFKKEDIHINIEQNSLTIEAKKEEVKEETTQKWIRQERNLSALKRSFELDSSIDENKVEAKYENGVLQINLVKTVKETKKIVVN